MVNKVKLEDVSSLISGYAFKSKDLGEVGIPVVKIKNVNNGRVDLSDTQFFPENMLSEKHSKFLLNDGDVLLAMTGQGSVGRVGRLRVSSNKKVLLNQRVGKFVAKSNLDLSYLYYILSSNYYEDILFNAATGSGQPNLSPSIVGGIEIPIFSLLEQKAIAHILGTLDNKIELNRQMNETLEAMAQALFKSWFVNFDPVIDNALLAGNSIPDELAERAEMRQAQLDSGKAKTNSEINNLFPSEFEFTEELGWIPKGWKVQLSNTLFDIRDGTHDSPKQVEEGKYLITSRHITTGVIDFDNAYFISQEDFEEVNRRSAVAPYDILITMIGTVGISHLVLQEEIDFAIKNVGLFRTGEDRRIAIFFYLYLKSKFMEHYLESRMAGTTQKYLTLKALRSLPVTKPSNELLTKFYEITSSYFNKIHANNQQVEALVKLRDTLLPKLMSGELHIADAEKLAENI